MGSLTLDVLLDENFDRQVIAYIETEGHYGEHVVDVLDRVPKTRPASHRMPDRTTCSSSRKTPTSWRRTRTTMPASCSSSTTAVRPTGSRRLLLRSLTCFRTVSTSEVSNTSTTGRKKQLYEKVDGL